MLAYTPEQQRERRECLNELRERVGESAGTRRHIGRCSRKGCRHTVAVDVEYVHEIDYRYDRLTSVPVERYWAAGHACPEHGHTLRFKAVEGRYSDKECGAKCRNAVGPSCDCQCAGANHGQGWLV